MKPNWRHSDDRTVQSPNRSLSAYPAARAFLHSVTRDIFRTHHPRGERPPVTPEAAEIAELAAHWQRQGLRKVSTATLTKLRGHQNLVPKPCPNCVDGWNEVDGDWFLCQRCDGEGTILRSKSRWRIPWGWIAITGAVAYLLFRVLLAVLAMGMGR